MFRKLMAGVVLCSVPVLSFGIAQIATTGSAGAAGTTTCTGAGSVVTFASPGLSDLGTASASAKSTTTTGTSPISCTSSKGTKAGTLNGSKIKAKSTTTCASDPNPPSPCPSGDYVYDSASQLATGASLLYKEDKTTSWKIGSTTYTADNTGSAAAGQGTGPGLCPSTEVGFVLTGHLSTSTKASTEITACLNTDTGTNTSGSFLNDIGAELGGNTGIVIATATLDGSASSIVYS